MPTLQRTWRRGSVADQVSAAGPRAPEKRINNTDADLFEYAGNTYVFYATGDQQTWGTIRVAMYPGPLKQFFESHFPENVPMIVFNAREGKYLYPKK